MTELERAVTLLERSRKLSRTVADLVSDACYLLRGVQETSAERTEPKRRGRPAASEEGGAT